MCKNETPLWDHLDACHVGFRVTREKHIHRSGFRDSGWSDGLFYCTPRDQTRLIPSLSAPLFFQFQDITDMEAPPLTLFGHVRTHTTSKANFELACQELEALFGAGHDNSASNTMSRRWDFGLASVTATVFPPALNRQFRPNSRHDTDPDSETECALTIVPAWRDPVTDTEQKWLFSYNPMFAAVPGDAQPLVVIQSYTVDWPGRKLPPLPGFGLSKDGAALLHIPALGLINILPRNWMTTVERNSLLPARGPGEASINIRFQPGGQDHLESSLAIAARVGDPYVFDDLAQDLANKLDLPLRLHEQLND